MSTRIMSCHICLSYHVAFSYLMMRRYEDAMKTASNVLLYLVRGHHNEAEVWKCFLSYSHFMKQNTWQTVCFMFLVCRYHWPSFLNYCTLCRSFHPDCWRLHYQRPQGQVPRQGCQNPAHVCLAFNFQEGREVDAWPSIFEGQSK